MAKAIKTVSTVVSKVEDLGNDTKRFTLVDQDDWELPPFRPGAHIDLHLAQGLVRTYSLCNEPDDDRRYVIAVKREREGRGGSNFLHDRVEVRQPISVSLPRAARCAVTTPSRVRTTSGMPRTAGSRLQAYRWSGCCGHFTCRRICALRSMG